MLMVERTRQKNENYFTTIQRYDGEDFIMHFRMSRQTAELLAGRYGRSSVFSYQASQFGKLSAWEQVLIFLWFAGHQSASFRDVPDRFSVTISSLFRINVRLIHFISGLAGEVIRWPDENEKVVIEAAFHQRGFPYAIGAVDGSHVRIDKPKTDPDAYCNRKKYFSIQLQTACDHRLKSRSLFGGFPGSVHHARVFARSELGRNLVNKCGRFVILADSAYPCYRNVITPFKDLGNLSRQQKAFNITHTKNRVVVEHCFGVLKQRFRQLYHIKLRSIRNICHFIRACCVLHNLATDDHLPNEPEGLVDEGAEIDHGADDLEDTANDDQAEGVAFRNYLLSILT